MRPRARYAAAPEEAGMKYNIKSSEDHGTKNSSKETSDASRDLAAGSTFGFEALENMPNPHQEQRSDMDRSIRSRERSLVWDFKSRGEPFLWGLGGALVLGIFMIVGFVVLIVYNGVLTFYPRPIEVVTLGNGKRVAGEATRSETFRPGPELLADLSASVRETIEKNQGLARRTLYRTGNFDLYNEDFRWVPDYDVVKTAYPKDMFYVERTEWGPFVGSIRSVKLKGTVLEKDALTLDKIYQEQKKALERRHRIYHIERNEIGSINYYLERERLELKKAGMLYGTDSVKYRETKDKFKSYSDKVEPQYQELSKEASTLKDTDADYTITLADINGREKTVKLSEIVRLYPANTLTFWPRLGVYFSRWEEFLTQEPREANTEGGVMPAIFGTLCMTVLMAISVAPFGVVAALYLREYAKQGRMVSLVRICVNNLAGVPSIVYGVFGLGFFAYVLGGNIDRLFFPERLPSPTFGTGGLLWASLTLALLTVPVVIVATEEALAAVPQSMREGSLACGASKWQTIRYIVLPRAMPGIMTGLILAMARGAGEVAPLMLVGVVKLAPELPIDHFFPYIHLERSFMHLGFHIYDLGFQSRNAEAAKPMVFVTTLLLMGLVFAMNTAAIVLRNRLKRKFFVGHF
jgi:phosphate transport system permease protein